MARADTEVMVLVEAVAMGTVLDTVLATALAMALAEVAASEATVTEAAATAAGMGVVIPPRLGAVASGAEDDCVGLASGREPPLGLE